MEEVNFTYLKKKVARHFGVNLADLHSKSRKRQISYARMVCAYLGRKLMGYSYPTLALLLGGKDHTSVIYACKRVPELAEKHAGIALILRVVEDDFYAKRSESGESPQKSRSESSELSQNDPDPSDKESRGGGQGGGERTRYSLWGSVDGA